MKRQEIWKWKRSKCGGMMLVKRRALPRLNFRLAMVEIHAWKVYDFHPIGGLCLEYASRHYRAFDDAVMQASQEIVLQLELRGVKCVIRERRKRR
jgi:hypothetical protein